MSRPERHNATAVAVTGMGAVTAAGATPDALWDQAHSERSTIVDGIGAIDDNRLFESVRSETSLPYLEALRDLVEAGPQNRFLLLTLYAIAQAMRQAGWNGLEPGDGILLGTTTGNILLWEQNIIALGSEPAEPQTVTGALRHEPLGRCLDSLRDLTGATGPMRLLSSACSSSTQAIALGTLWLREKRVKRCVAGGTEVLCRLTREGFQSLKLLSPRTAAPFDEARHGINLSEGAAFLCLEANPERPLGFVSGVGMSSDAHHMTAPHPKGRGCLEAMQAALADADLTPAEIDWVHAHGTGSAANDLAEATAIALLFGTGPEAPWTSSTKALHGHALGASGAIETVLCLLAMARDRILRTHNLSRPDPRLSLRHPEDITKPLRHVLKNSLGFGGSNAALVLSHPRVAERTPR